jgi:tetratricopeptide (TPR) repeat protein
MKKKLVLIFVLIALIGIGIVVATKSFTKKEAPSLVAEGQPIEVSLSANGALDVVITPGTPLVLEVLIRNAGRSSAVLEGAAFDGVKSDIDALVKTNELTAEEAQNLIEKERAKIKQVPTLAVKVDAGRFSFNVEKKGGAEPLPWRTKLVESSEEGVLTLDENNVGYATFVVPPEATAGTPEGAMQVFVVFENISKDEGKWSGKIISNPVSISFVKDTGTPDQQQIKQMAMIDYFLVVKDYEGAEKAVNQVLTIKPGLIDGLYLKGKVFEAKGDFNRALDAYEEALAEYIKKSMSREPPPPVLIRSVVRMQDKLGMKESKDSKN